VELGGLAAPQRRVTDESAARPSTILPELRRADAGRASGQVAGGIGTASIANVSRGTETAGLPRWGWVRTLAASSSRGCRPPARASLFTAAILSRVHLGRSRRRAGYGLVGGDATGHEADLLAHDVAACCLPDKARPKAGIQAPVLGGELEQAVVAQVASPWALPAERADELTAITSPSLCRCRQSRPSRGGCVFMMDILRWT
jgi:hypothetical protein